MLDTRMYGAYLHARPDGSVFYVGKGDVKRSLLLTRSRNQHHANVVGKHGKVNILTKFIPCTTEKTALELEVGIIKCLKRMGVPLTNKTEGGEGISGLGRGYRHTDDAKARMSKARIGNKYSEGNVVSEETRAKMAVSLTGNTNALGHVQTKEHKDKIAKANKGRQFCLGNKLTDEHKAAVAKGLRGNTNVRGYKWITNGVVSSLVHPDVEMPEGFKFGRKLVKANIP